MHRCRDRMQTDKRIQVRGGIFHYYKSSVGAVRKQQRKCCSWEYYRV